MSSITRNLIWKQCHENKRYFAIFMIWMLLAVCYCVGYEMGYEFRAGVGHFSSLLWMYGTVASLFLAMSVSQDEHSTGSFGFTSSLPNKMFQTALTRVTVAGLVLVIPMLVAALILMMSYSLGLIEQAMPRVSDPYVEISDRPTAPLSTTLSQLGTVTAISVMAATEMFLLLSLAGCWLRTRKSVGLLGAVLAMFFLTITDSLWTANQPSRFTLISGTLIPQSLVVHWGYGTETGSYTDHQIAPAPFAPLLLSLPVICTLAWMFAKQYGRIRKPSTLRTGLVSVVRLPSIRSRLNFRWPARWCALVWADLRQSFPIAFYGLLFALLLALPSSFQETGYAHSTFFSEFPNTMWFMAILWGVVVGSSLFSSELSSPLGSFWRSRPISHTSWFLCKYLIGLVVVLVVLDGFTILVSWPSQSQLLSPRQDAA